MIEPTGLLTQESADGGGLRVVFQRPSGRKYLFIGNGSEQCEDRSVAIQDQTDHPNVVTVNASVQFNDATDPYFAPIEDYTEAARFVLMS